MYKEEDFTIKLIFVLSALKCNLLRSVCTRIICTLGFCQLKVGGGVRDLVKYGLWFIRLCFTRMHILC